jgi:hypothetical protein
MSDEEVGAAVVATVGAAMRLVTAVGATTRTTTIAEVSFFNYFFFLSRLLNVVVKAVLRGWSWLFEIHSNFSDDTFCFY